MLPRTAEQLTDNIPSRHNSRKACPRESGGGNLVSCNRVWIPGLRSAPPGMTVLIHRQTNRASQAHKPPSMTDLSVRPNAPSAPPPIQSSPPLRANRPNPAKPSRCPRHRQTSPNGRTPPRTLLLQTPAAPGLHRKRTSPQGQRRCRTSGTRPTIDDRSFGLSERSIGSMAIDPASNPGSPAADPVPIQSGRNSGPLILGIVTLHRPD